MKSLVLLTATTAVAIAGPTHDPDEAVRTARAYLARHPELGDDFAVIANELEGEIRSVGFQQRYRGIPVDGGQVGFVFAHDHLTAVMPHVRQVTPAPSRLRADLVVIDNTITVRTHDGDDEIFTDDRGHVTRRSHRTDNFSGTVEYNAGERYASGPRINTPAHLAKVTANGTPTTTSIAGAFSFTGSDPADVITTCTGTNVTVTDASGHPATTDLAVPNNGAAIWNIANDELADAQVSTFVYGTTAIEKARTIDPTVAAWTSPFQFFVNETNPCNAFSTSDASHFGKATEACENTGRVADIVYHEFGHALHAHEVIAGVGMYTLQTSEGFADYNCASITNDSGIGRGLDFTGAASRDIDPMNREYHYPEDLSTDNHVSGMIVSGALWDLRKAVGPT
ncbi:MAG TPA: hypothetical protein VGC41_10825, partial [Kofleriaceae bacterium]